MNNIVKQGITKVPFTPYDIFGYLIPGSFFLIGTYLFDILIVHNFNNSNFYPIYSVLDLSVKNIGNNFLLGTIYLGVLIIIAYVLGHIIASMSSHFLDRILIEKGHGYPLQLLLKMNKEVMRKGRISAYFRGAFFWINSYLVLQYSGYVFNIKFFTSFANFIIYFFLVYSFISLIFLILYRINPEVDHSRIDHAFFNFIKRIYNYSMFYLFAGPYDLITYLYSILTRTRETFDDTFITKYKNYFESNFAYSAEAAGTNNYWFSFLYVSEKSPFANSLISTWLFLYSFARNLATCLFILFLYAFASLMYQHNNLIFNDSNYYLLLIPFVCFLGYLIMLTRYYYLYKNYYTKFIIRSFVFFNELEHKHKNVIQETGS